MPPLVTTVLGVILGTFLVFWGGFAVFYRKSPYDKVGALLGPLGLFLLFASALAALAPGFWSCH